MTFLEEQSTQYEQWFWYKKDIEMYCSSNIKLAAFFNMLLKDNDPVTRYQYHIIAITEHYQLQNTTWISQ